MAQSKTNHMLARMSAETGERIRASAASIDQTNRQLKASREAVDQSMQTLASTAEHCRDEASRDCPPLASDGGREEALRRSTPRGRAPIAGARERPSPAGG